MKTDTIQLVDRGRGLQLSTSRITVQDLVPYFQKGSSSDEILRWVPNLSREELVVVEAYYREHKQELDEEDRGIRAYVSKQIQVQRAKLPLEPREKRLARMKETLQKRQKDRNGQGHSGG